MTIPLTARGPLPPSIAATFSDRMPSSCYFYFYYYYYYHYYYYHYYYRS